MTDVERIADPPLYQVSDKRYSGEWRVVGTFRDPDEATQVATLLRSHGKRVRVEVIPAPHIP